jgi:glycosyltransferase involved in cell wall biosynthesis
MLLRLLDRVWWKTPSFSESIYTLAVRMAPVSGDTLYVYVPACTPSLLDWAAGRGMRVVGDQIILPFRDQYDLMRAHGARWRGWVDSRALDLLEETAVLEEELWPKCGVLVTGSEFVGAALRRRISQDTPVSVVPHPLNWRPTELRRSESRRPLVVGFLGQIGLRKGVPYVLEAASALPREQFRFVLVGPLDVAEEQLAPFGRCAEFRPAVPRSEVAATMRGFDVFVLPSLCEGAAVSVLEAMAIGVPVVCTPNAGAPVQDGVNGLLIPPGDCGAIIGALRRLEEAPELRAALAVAARKTVEAASVEAYGEALASAMAHGARGRT